MSVKYVLEVTKGMSFTIKEFYDDSIQVEQICTCRYDSIAPCRDAIIQILNDELDEFDASRNFGYIIVKKKQLGEYEINQFVAVKLALLIILTANTTQNRMLLIAYRIDRFTREEAVYWFGKIKSRANPYPERWSVEGLRTMLCGDARDENIAGEILKKYFCCEGANSSVVHTAARRWR